MSRKHNAHSAKKENLIKPSSALAPHGRALKRFSNQRSKRLRKQTPETLFTGKNRQSGNVFNRKRIKSKPPIDNQGFSYYNTTKEEKMRAIVCTHANSGRMSPHFKASEFQSKDRNEEVLICYELLDVLEKIREHFNSPVIINSGYRTPKWNEKVGGASNSYHCKGMAADIVVKGHTSKEVAEYAEKVMGNTGGIIRYTNFTHIDVREYKYRKGV